MTIESITKPRSEEVILGPVQVPWENPYQRLIRDISFQAPPELISLPSAPIISLEGIFISSPNATISYHDISTSWENAFFNYILMPFERFSQEMTNAPGEHKSAYNFLSVPWEDLFKIPVSESGGEVISVMQLANQAGVESLARVFHITGNLAEVNEVVQVISLEQFISPLEQIFNLPPPIFLPPPPPPNEETPPGVDITAGVPVSVSTDEDDLATIAFATLTSTGVGGPIVLGDPGDSVKGIVAIGTIDVLGKFVEGGQSIDGALITLNSNGSITYNPTGVSAYENIQIGESETDTFAYRVEDIRGNIITQIVNLTITAADDGYAAGTPVSIFTNSLTTIPFANLTSTEIGGAIVLDDPGDSVKGIVAIGTLDGLGKFVEGMTSIDGAMIVLNGDGSITYDPSSVSSGSTTDTFAYRVEDNHGNIVTQVVNVTFTSDFAFDSMISITTDQIASAITANTLTRAGIGAGVEDELFMPGSALSIEEGSIKSLPKGESVVDSFFYQVMDNQPNVLTQTFNKVSSSALTVNDRIISDGDLVSGSFANGGIINPILVHPHIAQIDTFNHNGTVDTNDAAFQRFGVLLAADGVFEILSLIEQVPDKMIDNGNIINSVNSLFHEMLHEGVPLHIQEVLGDHNNIDFSKLPSPIQAADPPIHLSSSVPVPPSAHEMISTMMEHLQPPVIHPQI